MSELRYAVHNLIGIANPDGHQLNARGRYRRLDGGEARRSGGHGRIANNRDAGYAGGDRLEQFQHFRVQTELKAIKPVALPPGRARLATKPLPTGSIVVTNTIGSVRLVCCKSPTIEFAVARTTSGAEATNSAAYLRWISPPTRRPGYRRSQ